MINSTKNVFNIDITSSIEKLLLVSSEFTLELTARYCNYCISINNNTMLNLIKVELEDYETIVNLIRFELSNLETY